MTTATPGHRSGKIHRAVTNGRFYAVLVTVVIVVSTVCDTIVKVVGK
jgi:hypothetical protein